MENETKKCKKCKKIFLQAPHNHLGGNGCPVCKLSKGEIKVANFLSGKKIFFEKQKIFDNLISINHLKFDFYFYYKCDLYYLFICL